LDNFIKANPDKDEVWADANYKFSFESLDDRANKERNDENINVLGLNSIKVSYSNSEEKSSFGNAIEIFNNNNPILLLDDEEEKESESKTIKLHNNVKTIRSSESGNKGKFIVIM